MQTCSDVRWHKTLANMQTRSSKFSHSEIKKHYVVLALIVACILGVSATFVEQRIGSQQKPGRQVNSPHCVHNAIGKHDRAISAAESNGQHHQVGDQEADDTRPVERLIYLLPGGKDFCTLTVQWDQAVEYIDLWTGICNSSPRHNGRLWRNTDNYFFSIVELERRTCVRRRRIRSLTRKRRGSPRAATLRRGSRTRSRMCLGRILTFPAASGASDLRTAIFILVQYRRS